MSVQPIGLWPGFLRAWLTHMPSQPHPSPKRD